MDELEAPKLELTDDQRAAWLDAVRKNHSAGNRSVLKTIGVTVERHYTSTGNTPRVRQAPPSKSEIDAYIEADPDFRDDYLEARGYSDDQLRAEVVRRGITGVDEPVFHQGQVVGEIRRYSDRLLEFIARTRLPEALALQAARHQIELTGKDGGPVQVEGRRVVSLGEVVELAQQLGVNVGPGVRAGDAGGSRLALPSPEHVLPDPRERE